MNRQVIQAETITLIEEWAHARNIINGADAKSQFFKLTSELGEWADGVTLDNRHEVLDGIGDALVVCTIIARQLGTDLVSAYEATVGVSAANNDLGIFVILGRLSDSLVKDQTAKSIELVGALALALTRAAKRHNLDVNTCLEQAYNDIKDRKGLMYNGVFVKSTDPRHDEILAELEFQNRPKQ